MESKNEEDLQKEINLSENELESIIADAQLDEVSLEENDLNLSQSEEVTSHAFDSQEAKIPTDASMEEIKEDIEEINKDAPEANHLTEPVVAPEEDLMSDATTEVDLSPKTDTMDADVSSHSTEGSAITISEETSSISPEQKDESGTISLSSNEMEGIIENKSEPDISISPEKRTSVEETISMDMKELQSLFRYLDKVLGYLPEEKVKEFAHSEYYDKYISLINQLGL